MRLNAGGVFALIVVLPSGLAAQTPGGGLLLPVRAGVAWRF